MRKYSPTALALAAALALPGIASAQDTPLPISANVAFTTDYVFRGISQTNERFAVQGGFDWAGESTGIYIGTWASNVDFDSETSVELDGYVGWAHSWGDFGVDIGYLHYNYPGESGLNTDEVYAKGIWKWITLAYYYTISDTAFGIADARGSGYFNAALEYTLPMGLTLGGAYGTTMYSGGPAGAPNDAGDYDDYKIYAGLSYTGLDFQLAWTDTDIDNPVATQKDRFVFTVSKSF
ncbi:MAG: hypothetical protein GTO41_29155 [Burkholderiales bacterium]|nr:hypothetical protein [Burkholderiales bacterium]